MHVNLIGVGNENFHTSEKVFISGVRLLVPICELLKHKGLDRRKAGSDVTEQGTDHQRRSDNSEVMNKL